MLKCTEIGWASSRTPPVELTALPRHHSWNKENLLTRVCEGCKKGKGGRKKAGERAPI